MAGSGGGGIVVEVVSTKAVFDELFGLRREVFMVEQRVDESIERDCFDKAAYQIAAAVEGTASAYMNADAVYVVARQAVDSGGAVVGTARIVVTNGADRGHDSIGTGGINGNGSGSDNASSNSRGSGNTNSNSHDCGTGSGHCRGSGHGIDSSVGRPGLWGRVGRVAVARDFRGQGLGRTIMDVLEKLARSRPLLLEGLFLGGQIRAATFYEKCGYDTVTGSEFVCANMHHVMFEKRLE